MNEEKNTIYYYLGLYGSLGLTMVLIIVSFMSIGIYIDKKLGTGTVWSLVLTLVGMVLGAWVAYRRIMKSIQLMDEEDARLKQEHSKEEENNKHDG